MARSEMKSHNDIKEEEKSKSVLNFGDKFKEKPS